VLPDFSVRLVELTARVASQLEEIFQEDIREYQQLESIDFSPNLHLRKGLKISNSIILRCP
jgi:hypothetical protein